ncbi:MAG: hypothetical protein SFV81_07035 [Pirellulaceae bacterium]|nr:hypothetical protein [Pirellulaceae bacterium]
MTTQSTSSESQSIIHVRSLGEFEFCPRAGIIAFESQLKNKIDAEPPRVPNLGYSPPFDIKQLEEELAKKSSRFSKVLFLTLAMATALTFIGNSVGFTNTAFLWIAIVLPAITLSVDWQDLTALWREYRRVQNAIDPKPFHDGIRAPLQVDWWDLVKSYQSAQPGEPYVDPLTHLVGKPWRILSFHRQRIPVILSRSETEQTGIKSTHLNKLAAYSHLLRQSDEQVDSDWGVVIFADTRTGYAVPINQSEIDSMLRLLGEFRVFLTRSNRGVAPGEPDSKLCFRCPNNRRRTFRKGSTETKMAGRTLQPLLQLDGKSHCDCGDRFQWQPPLG